MNTQEVKDSRSWKNICKIIIPFFLVVGGAQLFAIKILGLSFRNSSMSSMSIGQVLFVEFFSTVGTIGLVWFFRKRVDKRSFASIGLSTLYVKFDIFWGLIIGFIIMGLAFSGLLATGQIRFVRFDFNLINLIESILLYVSIAVSEELFMRGYVLNNLLSSFNKYIALLLSAAFFSLMHIGNDNISLLGLIGLFMAGTLLGIGYIYSNGLWFPVALHFSWNFFQGTIFGFNVSGIHQYSLTTIDNVKPNIWNGGNFGFEGSILSIIVQPVALFLVLWLFQNRESTI